VKQAASNPLKASKTPLLYDDPRNNAHSDQDQSSQFPRPPRQGIVESETLHRLAVLRDKYDMVKPAWPSQALHCSAKHYFPNTAAEEPCNQLWRIVAWTLGFGNCFNSLAQYFIRPMVYKEHARPCW
jgi:hypothetical protein